MEECSMGDAEEGLYNCSRRRNEMDEYQAYSGKTRGYVFRPRYYQAQLGPAGAGGKEGLRCRSLWHPSPLIF